MLEVPSMTRRGFVSSAAAIAAGAVRRSKAVESPDGMQAVLARIRPPTFPDRAFDIAKYGAVAGAQEDSSGAIGKPSTPARRQAAAACWCRAASFSLGRFI
jgi:hypothetical protein